MDRCKVSKVVLRKRNRTLNPRHNVTRYSENTIRNEFLTIAINSPDDILLLFFFLRQIINSILDYLFFMNVWMNWLFVRNWPNHFLSFLKKNFILCFLLLISFSPFLRYSNLNQTFTGKDFPFVIELPRIWTRWSNEYRLILCNLRSMNRFSSSDSLPLSRTFTYGFNLLN